MRRRTVALGVALGLLALFPLAGSDFYTELVSKVMILAIFALSLDLLVGYTGLVSFGHAAFFGVGAYSAGLLALHGIVNEPVLALLVAGLVATAYRSLGWLPAAPHRRG